MKLLFLSTCGKSNEPEDAAYLDLFLASFKKHVADQYDCYMLLFSTFDVENPKTGIIQQRANAMGLEGIVDVRGLRDMNLSTQAYEFMRGQSWYSNIGLNMNMLYDYAKMYGFFDAQWIFHTDTDIEFLPNFSSFLETIHPLTALNSKVMITLAGDAYPYNFYYKNKEYILESPKRIFIYDPEHTIGKNRYSYQKKTFRLNPNRSHPRQNDHLLIFNIEQQKVRNDFVGMSRGTAEEFPFNWVSSGYGEYLQVSDPENTTPEELEIEALWNEHRANSTLPLHMNLSQDKGAEVQYQLQSDRTGILRLQLRGYKDMAKHFSSGYVDMFRVAGENFRQYSHRRLREDYMEWESVWSQDYP